MTSSIKTDIWPIFRRRDLSPGVNDGVWRLKLYRYGPSDLALPDQSWIFSHGCREDVCPRNICSDCYILDNGDLYSWLSNDVDQTVWLLFHGILVLVFLLMVTDYFNCCTCACSLGIAAHIKIMGESSLVFSGLWFYTYLWLPSGSIRLCNGRRKSLKILKLLVSFRLCFVIVEVS
jgi:hypothetical protein